jgi:hypothetical protein
MPDPVEQEVEERLKTLGRCDWAAAFKEHTARLERRLADNPFTAALVRRDYERVRDAAIRGFQQLGELLELTGETLKLALAQRDEARAQLAEAGSDSEHAAQEIEIVR